MPAFRRVFKKYDRLNESIEENVRGMRVVKGFSREDYERKRFGEASEDIAGDFTRAERIVACNTPLMQVCLYFNMVFVLTFGSYLIISGTGSNIDVGQLSAMLTYGMQILISLMMLSMIYVILTISAESIKRICEVLGEEPTLTSPEGGKTEVKDGSIDFNSVNFKYSAKAKKNALSIDELLREPFLLTEKGMSYRRLLDERLARDSKEIQPVFEVGSADIICELVKENTGVSFLPDYVTEHFVANGSIVRIPIRNFEIELWKQILYHKDKWVTPQMQAVIKYLADISLAPNT
jgi:ABC-type multidrug transport system fused ATPase/permease subunit